MHRVLLALSLFAFACEQAPPEPPPPPGTFDVGEETLVTVGEHRITQTMLEVATQPMPEDQRKQLMEDENRRKRLVERLAFAEVLYHKALEENLHEDPEVQASLGLAQREVLANLMLQKLAEEEVTDQAIQAKYESMAVQFNRPQVELQHILVKQQDLANQLVEQIKAGEIGFLEAAKAHSQDRGLAQHGGDIGWTSRAPMPALKDAWENAPVGEVTGPIESRLGYHILKVTDRRDKVPLEEVRDQLEERVKIEAMRSTRDKLMSEAELTWAGEASGTEAGGDMDEVTPPGAKPPELKIEKLEVEEDAP